MTDAFTGNSGSDGLDELHELVGVYALGALGDAESEVFEDHLSTCTDCQAELVQLTEVVSELAPPASPMSREEAASDQPATQIIEPDSPVVSDDDGGRIVSIQPDEASNGRVLVAAAAAAVVALALVAGLLISGVFSQSRVEAISTASDVEIVILDGDAGALDLLVSVSERGVAFEAEALDALPEPELYVLWVFRHNAERPEFVGNITEFAELEKAWDLEVANADAFAISIEQAPNPDTPSDRVVFVGTRGDR